MLYHTVCMYIYIYIYLILNDIISYYNHSSELTNDRMEQLNSQIL